MTDLKSQETSYGEQIGSGGTDAILSSFFRKILSGMHIELHRFMALLERHVRNSGMASNPAEISTSRSALRRELMSPTMTWKVFMKGLLFLRVERAEIELVLFRIGVEKTSVRTYEFDVKQELDAETQNPEDKENDDVDNLHPYVNTLETFLREIMQFLDIDLDNLDEFLNDYMRVAKPGSKSVELHGAKCSIKREILKNRISWKIFVKGLILIRTYKMIFRLKLYHQNKLVSNHETILVFR